MKSFYVRGLCLVLGLMGLSQPLAAGEPFGSASLLPMPSAQQPQLLYPLVAPASYGRSQEELSPSDQPARALASPSTELSPEYQHAMKQSWDNGGCVDGACSPSLSPCCSPCPNWAVWAGGLVMGRANQCDRPVTVDAGTLQTVMSTNNAEQNWSGGFEIGTAWIMPNCCNALAVNYWGLFPSDPSSYVNAANFSGGIRPALGNIDGLTYDDGIVADNVFNRMTTASGTHVLTTGSGFNSVEINFLGNTQAWGLTQFGGGGCNGCNRCSACGPSCWQFGWLAGLRYFRFNESFLFQSDQDDTVVGDLNDPNELSYRIATTNNLWGFQFGGQGAWYFTNCFSIYGSGRFGVFNNHVTSEQSLSGQAGDAFINAGSFNGTAYRFSNSRNALAGVGQFDLGGRYQVGCHWSLYGGYRVVAISGVATAPSQIPANFSSPVNEICAGDSVILHGAFLGAQYAW
jgi:hypothetical protein